MPFKQNNVEYSFYSFFLKLRMVSAQLVIRESVLTSPCISYKAHIQQIVVCHKRRLRVGAVVF